MDFDEIAVRGLRGGRRGGHPRAPGRVDASPGTFGRMRAEDATALAMIVSELVQNAVEHGLAGDAAARSTVDVERGRASSAARTR